MPTAASAQCGEVTVGAANWSTAEIIANIDAFILTEGYGCTVTLTPTSTTQTLALAQGAANPLIVPEFWANGVDQEVLASMISNGDINIDSRPFPEAGEFWYVSAAFAEAYPELTLLKKFWSVLTCSHLLPTKVPVHSTVAQLVSAGAVSTATPTCSKATAWKTWVGPWRTQVHSRA